MRPGEHGPDELYEKFHVYKAKSEVQGDEVLNAYDKSDRLGNDGEFIFVLRPETNDKAAIEALLTYARVCEASYPELSRQIVEQLTELRDAINFIQVGTGCNEDEAYRILAERRKLRGNGSE